MHIYEETWSPQIRFCRWQIRLRQGGTKKHLKFAVSYIKSANISTLVQGETNQVMSALFRCSDCSVNSLLMLWGQDLEEEIERPRNQWNTNHGECLMICMVYRRLLYGSCGAGLDSMDVGVGGTAGMW